MKKDKGSEGYVIVISLVIATAVLLLLGVFLGSIIAERKNVERSYRSAQALHLAEAGVEKAIRDLNAGEIDNWDGDSDHKTKTLHLNQLNNIGECTVTISGLLTLNPVVSATGYVPEINIAIERRVDRRVKITLEGEGHGVFDYAVATEGGIKAEDEGTVITGNIYTDGDIEIEQATVDGDATATGSIDNSGTITGSISPDTTEVLTFPEFALSDYLARADIVVPDDSVPAGEWTGTGWKIEGVTYSFGSSEKIIVVKGNVRITNSVLTGPTVIVATGWIKGEATDDEASQIGTSVDHPVSLISAITEGAGAAEGVEEAIKMEAADQSSTHVYGILWAPNWKIKLEENSTVYGSIVSNGHYMVETGSDVIYSAQFNDEFYADVAGGDIPGRDYVVSRWEEK